MTHHQIRTTSSYKKKLYSIAIDLFGDPWEVRHYLKPIS
ncbi:predicted protein [Botrytis cinerea T4]|uniref:Uncharacterized protein n=1 Tax=Botryotinia fuckeliana (strain T4) TaxID=999810 RepID=G2XZD6_BOTF4|nr:predicted protein [Botrytis cinerea T4]